MSKKKKQIETVKNKFREFLSELKDLKESKKDKYYYGTNIELDLKGFLKEENRAMLSDLDLIVEQNLNSKQRKSKTIPGAISRLKDEELKKLNSIIRIGVKNVNQTPYAGKDTRWEREVSDALDISAAFMEELSNRL